jgi:hypothetical protein
MSKSDLFRLKIDFLRLPDPLYSFGEISMEKANDYPKIRQDRFADSLRTSFQRRALQSCLVLNQLISFERKMEFCRYFRVTLYVMLFSILEYENKFDWMNI